MSKMRIKEKCSAWLRLAKLQFQPIYFINYNIGAVAAYATYQIFFGLIGIFLLLEYTAPPLKFSYRGIGELVMSIMTGPYPILLGYIIQIGRWTDSLPWLLSIPVFLAALIAGAIGSIPDYRADMEVSRKRFAVLFGPRLTAIISLCLISFTAISGVLFWYFNILTGPGSIIIVVVIPYSLILSLAVIKMIKIDNYERTINRIFQLVIFYVLLFGLIPLLSLLWR